MGTPTHPNRTVRVKDLDRFKRKLNDAGDTAYHKPPTGIPKSDLAQDVQDSLDNVMKGATASTAGAKGHVPAPAAGDNTKFLRGDGSWSDKLLRASFVGTTLVFSTGAVFSGTTLLLG